MVTRSDLAIIVAVVAGLVVGGLSGLVVDSVRTFGSVGAMIGLVVGCSLTVLPPRTR